MHTLTGMVRLLRSQQAPPTLPANFGQPPEDRPKSPGRPWGISINKGCKLVLVEPRFKYYQNAKARAEKVSARLRSKNKRVYLEHRQGWTQIFHRP